MMKYLVTHAYSLSDSVREFTLAISEGSAPQLTPGCHFRVFIPTINDWRHYSCVMFSSETREITFAIRLNDCSSSSRYLASLQEGDVVTLEGPFNHFPVLNAEGKGRNIVIAGGIGITPLTGIVARQCEAGRTPQFHYYAATREQAIYSDEIIKLVGEQCHFHFADGEKISIQQLLQDLTAADRIHVCGPARLLNDVLHYCDSQGFPRCQIAFELFGTVPVSIEGNEGYEVEAVESGITVKVAPGQSLLDALEAVGLELLSDCRRGECGLCALEVLEGEVEHHDFIMSPEEAAASDMIYPCVSRAKGTHLKIAL
ncbi:iron-sulfur cluster-binding domain-containing protein [Photorhabdus noenieputensis]|uniref:flavin reductase family protein n=1 Tax=Photorhabdus noenieputensis TaxID=1208607 RepID=UPI001BD5953C|nr:iron-sulfur cluster-binding domain-containing protein [Photorhabdus noenieputensis]MBS9437730.1 iron-sulfur cluster-binding domain-containing protein [Photorhabdus noenieputensis]